MKSIISLSIDTDIIMEIRNKDINVSKLVNGFLREHLNIPELQKPKSIIQSDNDIMILENRLAELRQHRKKLAKTHIVIRGDD